MKMKNIKILICGLVYTIVLSSCGINLKNPTIDIFKSFVEKKGDNATDENVKKATDSVSYLDLTNDEETVVLQIENAIKYIKNVDIDKIYEVFGDSALAIDKKAVKEFFSKNQAFARTLKSLLAKVDLIISSVATKDDIVEVNTSITCPSLTKLLETIMPEVLLKNVSAFVSGNVTEENINSILGVIDKAIEDDSLSMDNFDIKLKFKKIDGKWVIVNSSELMSVIEDKYKDIIDLVKGLNITK